jgi:hypothetical protein
LSLIGKLISISVLAVIVGAVFYESISKKEENSLRAAEQMESIISRAAVQCYALEGSYPGDVYYLAKYGVIFDEERYYYVYNTNFIGNYMPDIQVIAKE